MTQCPNCHQYMGSYTEYTRDGMNVTWICRCGYKRKDMSSISDFSVDISEIKPKLRGNVGASKRRSNNRNKNKHKNKRGIHEKK